MIKIKKLILVIMLLCLHAVLVFPQPEIKELSSFRLQGIFELREEPGFSAPYKYRTLNHEGGVKVRVLKIGKTDYVDKQKGKWLYVLLTAPLWADSGEWIKKHNKFWIFLPETTDLFDFEE